MTFFKIAVLGATGYIGTPYREEIRACPDTASIVSLCARRQGNLRAAAELDGAAFYSSDWREVLSHPDVNLAMICTPDALHHEAAMECAQRGLHLFCEKPVGLNSGEALEIWEAYRSAGLRHFVPFWTRYVPIVAKAREIARSGQLGDLRGFTFRWHNPRPPAMPFTWRDDAELSSAGSIADVGSHAYDALRWILDTEAEQVLTHAEVLTPAKPDLGEIDLEEALTWGSEHRHDDASQYKRGTAYDYASIAIQMRDGMVGTIVLSHAPYFRKGLAPEIELHGVDASLAVDRTKGELRLYRPDSAGKVLETFPEAAPVNRFEQFVFPALHEATGQSELHPDLEDGYLAQLFTDAAALSAKQGAWVNLRQ